jgi:hypothetical protein
MNNPNKTATININGISTTTRKRMLEEFLYKHDVDLALSQEVTNTKITMFKRYIHALHQHGDRGSGKSWRRLLDWCQYCSGLGSATNPGIMERNILQLENISSDKI